jgi:hypothetical protein
VSPDTVKQTFLDLIHGVWQSKPHVRHRLSDAGAGYGKGTAQLRAPWRCIVLKGLVAEYKVTWAWLSNSRVVESWWAVTL